MEILLTLDIYIYIRAYIQMRENILVLLSRTKIRKISYKEQIILALETLYISNIHCQIKSVAVNFSLGFYFPLTIDK